MKKQTTNPPERPILFSGEMVRAILEGRKTQTRRVINFPEAFKCSVTKRRYPLPPELWRPAMFGGFGTFRIVKGERIAAPETCGMWNDKGATLIGNPYGRPGDRLWVRETFLIRAAGKAVVYRAVIEGVHGPVDAAGFGAMYGGWKPSIFMPRWASRLTLEITKIRAERIQQISESDAIAEGRLSRAELRCTWNNLNEKRGFGWEANPWVWVIAFKRCWEVSNAG